MEFVEIMKWIGFVSALIGGGWGALKLKAWFTPDAKDFEIGLAVETPFGVGRVIWQLGKDIKIELLETGETFIGLTKEVKPASLKALEAANLLLDKRILEHNRKNTLQRVEGTRAARLRSKKKDEK